MREGTFLELPSGTTFLGLQKFGSRMFVRECYSELAEVTFGIMEGGSNLIITGNPGIGKSFFLFFFMYLLRTQAPDATVVLYRHLEDQWYLFSKDTILIASKEQLESILTIKEHLRDPSTWYLVDTATPLEVNAKTLLVTSPYVQRYKEFRKTNADIRFMPVWSKEEIEICRKVTFTSPLSLCGRS